MARNSWSSESQNTGKPIAVTAAEETSADGRPDPLLRRCSSGPGRTLRGRVHERLHLDHPPRAHRCYRAGHSVELPDDDGGVEVRSRRSPPATPWCSSPATPLRPPPCGWPRSSHEADALPAGVFNVVCGDRDTGRALVEHPTPQMVAITGSVRAGMQVAESAAKDVKRVHLELGGKAPVVIFDDADVEAAAEGSRSPATSTPDRTAPPPPGCSSRRRSTTISSRPWPSRPRACRPHSKTGPVGMRSCRRSTTPISSIGCSASSSVLPSTLRLSTGGVRQGDRGFFIEPTVVAGLQQDDEMIQNEIFGPGHHDPALHRRSRSAALG